MRPDPMVLSPASIRAMSDMFDRLERAWYPAETVDISESWDYQAWPVDEFMAGLEVCAKMTDGREFIDVGSGIGTKMALAARMGFNVYGIEFRAQYSAMTSYLCPEGRVYDIDARGFSRYGSFDVIYAYLPLRRMNALLEHMLPMVKPTAVLFLPECDGLYGRGWVPADGKLPVWVNR